MSHRQSSAVTDCDTDESGAWLGNSLSTLSLPNRSTTEVIGTCGCARKSVDYLVEGSVRGEGRRLRITCKLIRVSDQSQVWSESFDREATNLLVTASRVEHDHRRANHASPVARASRRVVAPSDQECGRIRSRQSLGANERHYGVDDS
jgi:hypothetical protein